MRRVHRWFCTAATVVLAGCASSPPIAWHSLVPAAGGVPTATDTSPMRTTLAVGLVTIPDEVDRPQLVVRGASGAPALLDGERWSEPLKAQLPRALALGIGARRPDVLVVAMPGGAVATPARRLVVDVQRFELQRERAVLRAVWTLRPGTPGNDAAPAARMFETAVPVDGAGSAAGVAAMRAALDQLVVQISRAL